MKIIGEFKFETLEQTFIEDIQNEVWYDVTICRGSITVEKIEKNKVTTTYLDYDRKSKTRTPNPQKGKGGS